MFFLIWGLALLHLYAERNYIYWLYRWSDLPVHFIGGVWVGIASLWVYVYSGLCGKEKELPSVTATVFIATLGGIAFGAVWELYDYWLWVLNGEGLPVGYALDTVLDVLMDTVGAICGGVLYVVFGKVRRG
jgi:hypothetical protein